MPNIWQVCIDLFYSVIGVMRDLIHIYMFILMGHQYERQLKMPMGTKRKSSSQLDTTRKIINIQ